MMVNAAGTSASPTMNTASGVTSRYGRLFAAYLRPPSGDRSGRRPAAGRRSGDPAAGAACVLLGSGEAFTVRCSARELVRRGRDCLDGLRDGLGASCGGVQIRVDRIGELWVPGWRAALEHRLGRGQHGTQG